MKQYAISDIHGCLKSFKALLKTLDYSKDDELYLLGDYMDRGPDSKGVVDYIWQLQSEGYQVYCIRGNHDHIVLDAANIAEWEGSWLYHGGRQTLASFGITRANELPKTYLDFFRNLPYFINVGKYILVHAGLNFNLPDPMSNLHDLMWMRHWYDDLDKAWLGDRIIVHGHTPTKIDAIRSSINHLNKLPIIGIDNGCVYKSKPGMGQLCALELGTHELYFQPFIG